MSDPGNIPSPHQTRRAAHVGVHVGVYDTPAKKNSPLLLWFMIFWLIFIVSVVTAQFILK